MNEYVYDEVVIGQKESFRVSINEDMMRSFAEVTGDINSLHIDCGYAKSLGYNDRVAYGMLTSSFLSTLAGMYLPGKYSLIHEVSFKLPVPVYVGDELLVEGEVIEKNDLFKYIVLKVTISNNEKKKVLRGKMTVGLLK